MTPRQRAVPWAILVTTTVVLGAQTPQIRPGQYEVTIEMNLAIPKEAQKAVTDAAGLDKDTRLECYTADDVKDFAKFLAREMEEETCKISDLKSAGNKVTFTTTCKEDDIQVMSKTEMTFAGDSFTTATTAKDDKGRISTIKGTAKRVGDCK
jgi:hypothetical protein